MVFAVVLCQRILNSIQNELSVGDTVGMSAYQRTKVARAVQVAFEIVMPEYDVANLARAVRYVDVSDDGAIISDLHFHALVVSEREDLDLLAIWRNSEMFGCDFHKWFVANAVNAHNPRRIRAVSTSKWDQDTT